MQPAKLAWLVAISVAAAVPVRAQTTWWVDDDATFPGTGTPSDPYATIQFAISRSATLDGDTILVLSGTYLETLDFLGKTLSVRGTDGAALTRVDARQSGSVVTAANGEGPGAVLEGFTLTGGSAAEGGGVRCVGSSLVVRGCDIVVNEAVLGGGVYASDADLALEACTMVGNLAGVSQQGGGLWIGNGSTVSIDGCEARDNAVPGSGYGGGAYVGDATLVARTSVFRENEVGGAIYNDPGFGAGLYAQCVAQVTIEDCAFVRNGRAVYAGAGLCGGATVHGTLFEENGFGGTGNGGGAAANGCTLELFDCEFVGNQALGEGYNGYGGGVEGAALALRCTFVGNVANFGGGARISRLIDCEVRENLALTGAAGTAAAGGGLLGGSATGTLFERNEARNHFGSPPFAAGGGAAGATLDHCVLIGNRAEGGAGVSGGEADHCSLFGNEALHHAGAADVATVRDSIAWGNGPEPLGLQPDATYSLVEGGAPGVGNLDGSPRYWAPLAGDLHLLPGSACIDAGDPAGPTDPDGSRADMGALPFDASHCGTPGPYCEGKASSLGCVARISSTGSPSLGSPDDFFVRAEDVVSGQAGLLVWSLRAGTRPVFGGALCLAEPVRRLALGNSGGSASLDCSGSFAFHLSHALMAQAGMPVLAPLHVQILYRDPRAPEGEQVVMSDALELAICP